MSVSPPPASAESASGGPAGRPRTLVVGELALSSGEAWLRVALDSRTVDPDEARSRLDRDPPELVLLDGRLPGAAISPILERVGHTHRLERPAVVVVTEEGRGTELESSLLDHADDFVNGALGPEVLLARVNTALRVRGVLAELARKNGELRALSASLEGLAGRMAEELRLASQIQRSLLPPPLVHPRLDLAAEFIPVREIGGDYYDVFALEGGRMAVALGDVMGKGVPAALLAAHLKACLRAQSPGEAASPAEVIARVNRVFGELTPRGLFATLLFGVFDFASRTLRYVNAGHEPGLLVHGGGEVEPLGAGGPVLGLFEDSEYVTGRIELRDEDVIVLHSDGLTDRTSPTGELYGPARLRDAVRRVYRDPARIALYALLGDVQGFAGDRPAEDDQTLIVARVRAEP